MDLADGCLDSLGSSLIAVFFTQRVRLEDFKSLHGLRQISLPRLYLALLFLFSWVFFITSTCIHNTR